MRRALFPGVALVLMVSGCQSVADRRSQDDAECRSWGAQPGTTVYAQCRAAQMQNRTQNAAIDQQHRASMGLIGAALLTAPPR
jgi:hypothetical protein